MLTSTSLHASFAVLSKRPIRSCLRVSYVALARSSKTWFTPVTCAFPYFAPTPPPPNQPVVMSSGPMSSSSCPPPAHPFTHLHRFLFLPCARVCVHRSADNADVLFAIICVTFTFISLPLLIVIVIMIMIIIIVTTTVVMTSKSRYCCCIIISLILENLVIICSTADISAL